MDVLMLSRIQFALTAGFHYLFPPMTIGLSWIIVILEIMYIRTKKEEYKQMVIFWTKIFALFFALGVATGFVQLFAFGNNWSKFSKFVGDVFGTLLAAEGVFAFFLEAGFLGVMLFGWGKVKPWVHLMSSILVSFGASFSATWIVMANSWMQTPAGYKIIGEGENMRAVITDLWAVYFNPSFLTRLGHVLIGCGLMGTFLIVSISAFYLLKKRHMDFSRFTMKLGLITSMVFLLLQLWSADSSAKGVVRDQPTKLAAMEGVFETQSYAPYSLIGIVDMKEGKVHGIAIPGVLSFLCYNDFSHPVKGLNEFPKEDWPYVPGVFYCYRTMIYAWGAMMLIAIIGFCYWKSFERRKWFLWFSVIGIAFPYLANIAGWFTAEMGRQPWVVYNVMRTSQGVSSVISRGDVIASLVMFVTMYILLGFLFIFILNRKIHAGPVSDDTIKEDAQYRDPYLGTE